VDEGTDDGSDETYRIRRQNAIDLGDGRAGRESDDEVEEEDVDAEPEVRAGRSEDEVERVGVAEMSPGSFAR
jgi:hypothetical protein